MNYLELYYLTQSFLFGALLGLIYKIHKSEKKLEKIEKKIINLIKYIHDDF